VGGGGLSAGFEGEAEGHEEVPCVAAGAISECFVEEGLLSGLMCIGVGGVDLMPVPSFYIPTQPLKGSHVSACSCVSDACLLRSAKQVRDCNWHIERAVQR
jgi:hypothetical protein